MTSFSERLTAVWEWSCQYVCDFTWWETVGKLAPIGTALIALTAALIAWSAIRAQRDIARRRAAVDFFLKTEMDKTVIELYNKFRKNISSMTSKPTTPLGHAEYEDIRAFLNICELIAVGVNERAFSDRVSWAYWGLVLPQSYADAEPLIEWIRATPGEGSKETYCELQKLCEGWRKKPPRR
jgi:Domain of unknown function (DUF4760)